MSWDEFQSKPLVVFSPATLLEIGSLYMSFNHIPNSVRCNYHTKNSCQFLDVVPFPGTKANKFKKKSRMKTSIHLGAVLIFWLSQSHIIWFDWPQTTRLSNVSPWRTVGNPMTNLRGFVLRPVLKILRSGAQLPTMRDKIMTIFRECNPSQNSLQ